jgi:hypothetical protein
LAAHCRLGRLRGAWDPQYPEGMTATGNGRAPLLGRSSDRSHERPTVTDGDRSERVQLAGPGHRLSKDE